MKVLALNCGSSSLKFQLLAFRASPRDDAASTAPEHSGDGVLLARGSIERVGGSSTIRWSQPGRGDSEERMAVTDHADAVRRSIARLRASRLLVAGEDLAVGHRVVHGGARFVEPARIDTEVISAIESLEDLVPLHNAPALAGIGAAREELGADVPAVAVFDTAFHRHLPAHAARFPIPSDLTERHGIRRVGFHGLAHRWMSERHAALTRNPDARVVTVQLGHGCSCCAIDAGRSVDVSMGFSPLEGLMMGTRSGNIDPALVPFLVKREGIAPDEVARVLNERSGLLGVSCRSADMRDLLAAGDEKSALAVEMFVHSVCKSIGAHLAVLRGARAVVFGGGIGEKSVEVRARICARFGWCGLTLDPERNARTRGETRISAEGARLEAWVIPVQEERLIAQDTFLMLRSTTSSDRASER